MVCVGYVGLDLVEGGVWLIVLMNIVIFVVLMLFFVVDVKMVGMGFIVKRIVWSYIVV